MDYNVEITPEELAIIRRMEDFDIIMLISEVNDHGWETAQKLIPLIDKTLT